jgi:hypothetical protein
MVEHLPSKPEALSSNHRSIKKKKKYPTQKRTGGVAEVVECLPDKHEAEFKPQYQPKRKHLFPPHKY